MAGTLGGSLFSLRDHTENSWARAEAFLSGSASLAATFDRGIDLSAAVDVGGTLQGAVGQNDKVSAAISGAFSAGAALEAAFPIDLFTQFGIITRAKLEAEAAAWIAAEIEVSLTDLVDALNTQFSGVWGAMLKTFLDEVSVEAGIWAKAAFAAEIIGEIAVAGTFFPSADVDSPGFTVSAHYSAGVGLATGFHFVANLDFPSPQALVDRLATDIMAAVEDAVPNARMPQQDTDAANTAQQFLKLVFPIATRTMYELGVQLLDPTDAHPRITAATTVVKAFVREAQEFALRALTQYALGKIGDRLAGPVQRNAKGLAPQDLDALAGALNGIRAAIFTLSQMQMARPDDWVVSVVGATDALMELVDTNALDQATEAEWKSYVSLLWAAAVLAVPVIKWVEAPSQQTEQTLFGLALAPVSDASAVAQFVAQAIRKPAGTGLTVADVAQYVIAENPGLAAEVPEAAPILSWIGDAFEFDGRNALWQNLLGDLSDLHGIDPTQKLPILADAISKVVDNQIIPNLFARIGGSSRELGEVLSGIAAPVLTVLNTIVIPSIENLDGGNAAKILREQISSALLQFFVKIVVGTANSLVQRGSDEAAKFLREVSQDVGRYPVIAYAMAAVSSDVLGSPLVPADIEEFLDDVAGLLDLWNNVDGPAHGRSARDDAFALLQEILELGLSADTTQVEGLNNPHQLAQVDKIRTLALHEVEELAIILLQVVLALLALFIHHWVHLAEAVVQLIEQAAEAAFQAIKDVLNQIGQALADLATLIGNLEQDIANLAAQIAQDIDNAATRVQDLCDDALQPPNGVVYSAGWAAVSGLLDDCHIGFAKGIVQPVYDAVFDLVKGAIDAPLKIIEGFAEYLHDEITSAMLAGSFDPQTMADNIRNAALSLGAADWVIDLKPPWPLPEIKVTLPGTHLLGQLIDSILQDAGVFGVLQAIADAGNKSSADQAQLANAQSQQQSETVQQQAAPTTIQSLGSTGQITITIGSPIEQSVYNQGSAHLVVNITGINTTFVTQATGMPARVKLFFNGSEYAVLDPSLWTVMQDGSLTFYATLVVDTVHIIPFRLGQIATFAELTIPSGTTIAPQVSRRSPVPSLAIGGASARTGKAVFRHSNQLTVARSGQLAQSARRVSTRKLPVLVASVAPTALPSDGAKGVRWINPYAAGISLKNQVPWRGAIVPAGPTIPLRRGLNTLHVVVGCGDGKNQGTSAVRTFYLTR